MAILAARLNILGRPVAMLYGLHLGPAVVRLRRLSRAVFYWRKSGRYWGSAVARFRRIGLLVVCVVFGRVALVAAFR